MKYFSQNNGSYKLKLVIIFFLSFSCSNNQSSEKVNHNNLENKIIEDFNQPNSKQLIIVLTKDSSEFTGYLFRYEWHEDRWKQIDDRIDITVGKNGMAKGLGEEIDYSPRMDLKIEGDGKSPSGIFTIGDAFGFAKKENVNDLMLNYLQIDSLTRCIEDIQSSYYNLIVQKDHVENDWKNADKMRNVSLYEWGFSINHNKAAVPSRGSCVFFHIWRAPGKYTLGCTAMSKENILEILKWINPERNPIVVQYVYSDYQNLRQIMNLPDIVLP